MSQLIGWIVFLLICLSGLIGMTTLIFVQKKVSQLFVLHRALRMSLNDVMLDLRDHRKATQDYTPFIYRIQSDVGYIKAFCEEYTWRLVHFTDDELAYLAEGERLRQERMEHERNGNNDPVVQWAISPSQLSGLPVSFPPQVVREQVGREDLRDDARLEVPDWGAISNAQNHRRGRSR